MPQRCTLQAFGIYAVGFVARPVGAAIFGHYGDRIGRKAALIATLLLMGMATFLVAFVPTYEQIGIWGAIILTALRFIQGVGVGGEWSVFKWARSPKGTLAKTVGAIDGVLDWLVFDRFLLQSHFCRIYGEKRFLVQRIN